MEIDWYEVAMAIIDGVALVESYTFEHAWPLPEETKEKVLQEYEAWSIARKSKKVED